MTMQTTIDHAATQSKFRSYDGSQLRFVISDCQAAIKAYPEGHKAGYYADEISYAAMEINRRRQAAK